MTVLARLQRLQIRGDERGSLIALEDEDIGFPVRRVYYIFGTAPGVSRGGHAHRALEQLAICVAGSCLFHLDDGLERQDIRLDRPDVGLRMGSMIWREMHDFSPDCVLLVLASQPYDESDYIRDHREFLSLVRGAR